MSLQRWGGERPRSGVSGEVEGNSHLWACCFLRYPNRVNQETVSWADGNSQGMIDRNSQVGRLGRFQVNLGHAAGVWCGQKEENYLAKKSS